MQVMDRPGALYLKDRVPGTDRDLRTSTLVVVKIYIEVIN